MPAQRGTVPPRPAPGGDAPVVAMAGVRFTWPGVRAFTLRVDDLRVLRGEKLLLIGPSGSGKSTLLSLLCGIVVAGEGAVSVLGADLSRLSGPARGRFRAEHFGIIFQMFNLLPYGSVLDNVLLPHSFAAARRRRCEHAGSPRAEAERLLTSLGLESDVHEGQAAASLSVGQQQRVAAARALIGSPEVVVADEPTSSLDRDRQFAFLDLLFGEVGRAGTTLVMVSHDTSLAPRFDRAVTLADIAQTERGPR